ncbi:hypothetical protein VIGAN_UM001200 [Vigna angularis var. angularis]|uniref:Uncharacterized protein n=1 Tax=Vigna angularis var. angularis TaxID=157739 RepID=A0A0S3TCY6_PHAAN|nr:hypothetical protein VIGAN_UM001200 [Vigna angularis var. angularis]
MLDRELASLVEVFQQVAAAHCRDALFSQGRELLLFLVDNPSTSSSWSKNVTAPLQLECRLISFSGDCCFLSFTVHMFLFSNEKDHFPRDRLFPK